MPEVHIDNTQGAVMPTLQIEHPITDFGAWSSAFAGFPEARPGATQAYGSSACSARPAPQST